LGVGFQIARGTTGFNLENEHRGKKGRGDFYLARGTLDIKIGGEAVRGGKESSKSKTLIENQIGGTREVRNIDSLLEKGKKANKKGKNRRCLNGGGGKDGAVTTQKKKKKKKKKKKESAAASLDKKPETTPFPLKGQHENGRKKESRSRGRSYVRLR